ncbi:MAG: hypothetical protein JKY65_21555 [Planctomycetes bacterium]|nr:hypothetical protein [Planctomycetota bacterium]
MHHFNFVSRLLVPLLLASSVALAEEAPTIDTIYDDLGRESGVVTPGRTFEVRGTNLYEAPADPKAKGFPGLSATLGGRPLAPLAASSTSLRFQVALQHPERKRQSLVIRFRGRRLTSRVDVGPSPQIPDVPDSKPAPVEITRFTSKSTGAGARFRVEGEALGLVDRMKVSLSLSLNGAEIRQRLVKIEGERFQTTFGPFSKRLPVGAYSVDLSFTLNMQSRSAVRTWLKALGKQERAAALVRYKQVRRRAFVNVGGTGPGGQILPVDTAPQEARLRERALASAKASEALLVGLEAKLALAQRIYFRDPKAASIDEARYLQWLVDKGHAQDRASAERLLADTSVASRRGKLDEVAWARWVQEEIHVGISKELVELKAFAAETLCPIDARTSALMERALGQLLEIARSRPLFKRAKLALPSALNSPGLGVSHVPGATPKAVRATLRELRRRVGG